MRASSKARGEANAISCVRSYSSRSSIHSFGVSFLFISDSMRPLVDFCKAALSIRKVVLPDAAHRLPSNDEQVLHRPGLQDFFVKRRGTGSSFAPNHFHAEGTGKPGEAEEHSSAHAGNRLVRERQAGANGEEVENEVVTPSAAAVGEREKLV